MDLGYVPCVFFPSTTTSSFSPFSVCAPVSSSLTSMTYGRQTAAQKGGVGRNVLVRLVLGAASSPRARPDQCLLSLLASLL